MVTKSRVSELKQCKAQRRMTRYTMSEIVTKSALKDLFGRRERVSGILSESRDGSSSSSESLLLLP